MTIMHKTIPVRKNDKRINVIDVSLRYEKPHGRPGQYEMSAHAIERINRGGLIMECYTLHSPGYFRVICETPRRSRKADTYAITAFNEFIDAVTMQVAKANGVELESN